VSRGKIDIPEQINAKKLSTICWSIKGTNMWNILWEGRGYNILDIKDVGDDGTGTIIECVGQTLICFHS
jgi:hypothetical protein